MSEWNGRQKFDARGVILQVGELTAGGYAVFRFHREDAGHAIVASERVDTLAAAEELAEKLRKSALT